MTRDSTYTQLSMRKANVGPMWLWSKVDLRRRGDVPHERYRKSRKISRSRLWCVCSRPSRDFGKFILPKKSTEQVYHTGATQSRLSGVPRGCPKEATSMAVSADICSLSASSDEISKDGSVEEDVEVGNGTIWLVGSGNWIQCNARKSPPVVALLTDPRNQAVLGVEVVGPPRFATCGCFLGGCTS